MASQQGISYAEFTYQLLQGYDFYQLNKEHGCTIQIGGSDQWGNIISGLELINRLNPSSEKKGYGIITPLLTTTSGEKFGKSAGNAVWLSGELTSAFDFYQVRRVHSDSPLPSLLTLYPVLPSSARRRRGEVSTDVYSDASIRYRTGSHRRPQGSWLFRIPLEVELTLRLCQCQRYPEQRIAQRALADEVTLMIHGGRSTLSSLPYTQDLV